ncbi:hypothetical protein CLAIMM_14989 [Cladophialophora immunda]|nr:hypothetical protein CLAIMM_14989 [Cladophialophora immunda]
MAAQTNGINGHHNEYVTDYDAIVVGAGFAGLRLIVELRKLGISFKVLEAGTDVGGTWYWNRYPGAQTDSESWVYILNISKELNAEWTWKERFPRQPEVLDYLRHVADRFDMRKDIQFQTWVKSATWDEGERVWNIQTEQSQGLRCKYFICATGALSAGRDPPFSGVARFKGESFRTYAWPRHAVDFKGKRVGIIGTGATGVQLVPTLAHSAKSVTVFQRTANYVLPARNHPLTAEQQEAIKRTYDEVWQVARSELFGMCLKDSKVTTKEMENEAAIQRVLDYGWELGGFRFVFETFADLVTSEEANTAASNFVRNKIRAIVQDPETAELLCPDHPLMAKRPPLGHYYFEAFNRPHVTLVDIKSNPIQEITETGVRLTGKDSRQNTDEFELDVIIYAIGFDASTGAITRMEIRGREADETLGERWNRQLETLFGVTVSGYPNLFMVAGPQIPLGNFPVLLDNNVGLIGRLIEHARKHGEKTTIEPKPEAMAKWTKLVGDVFGMTVLAEAAKKAGSWMVGANVPGKRVAPLFWMGGMGSYFELCDADVKAGFPSMYISVEK